MHKTKLGISVGLMGALICLFGAIFGLQWFFLAIVGYVLLKEENEWLRRLSIKVVIILISAAILSFLVKFVLSDFLYDFINLFTDDEDMVDILWPGKISNYTTKYIGIAADILLIIAGIKSLSQKHFSVKPIDDLISNNV